MTLPNESFQWRVFLKRRLLDPILALLKHGASPERLAWAIAGGATISLFPLFGLTTGLCFVFGWIFGLNPVAIQVANYAFGPLQLLSIPLWIRLGERAFNLPPITFNPRVASEELFAAPAAFFSHYGASSAAAVVAWAVASPFIAFTIRAIARPILFRLAKSNQPRA